MKPCRKCKRSYPLADYIRDYPPPWDIDDVCVHCRYRSNVQTNTQRAKKKYKVDTTLTLAEWLQICETQGFACNRCGEGRFPLEIDHIIPMSKGGDNTAANVQGLCKSCNLAKGNSLAGFACRMVELT